MLGASAAKKMLVNLAVGLSVTAALAASNRYFYDEVGRLVRVERADCTVISYTYDGVGNRLTRSAVVDTDCDGVRNTLDCAPGDGTAFAIPQEVATLVLGPDRQTLSWDSAAPTAGIGTVHEVLRGRIPEFPVGAGAGEACLASSLQESSIEDTEVPSPGSGFWYLVRARDNCGVGGYGHASDGSARLSDTCP